MKAPLGWLREFVDIEVSAADLAERLTRAGLEVEGIEQQGSEIEGVVVGEIVAVEPHPNADRLSVCEVHVGDGTRKVVCGAPNALAGARAPFAFPGTTLPNGRRIEVAQVRGIASAGMLCSEAELGLGANADALWLLPADAARGEPLRKYLGIDGEVLDVAIPPNRGDCLSMIGLAREIAALYGVRVHRQKVRVRERVGPAADLATVRVEDPHGCPRYTVRHIYGVRVGPSPQWMQRRLLAVDVRPINNVVDVTNYVMFEHGQPLHAFDYDRLPQRQIVVRRAEAGTRLRTLDDRERTLTASDLLITTGDEPIAIAGVMGGASSEVTADTGRVLLESACFDPSTVRRTSRRLGLRSESSFRFERGVDVQGVVPALDRAATLIAELGGGRVVSGILEDYPVRRQVPTIGLRIPRIEFLLGLPVDRGLAARTLRRLGARVRVKSRQSLEVIPPSYRHDLEREVDLIEEIIRLVGYDQVPATLPSGAMQESSRVSVRGSEMELRRFMAAQGFHEVIGLSFASVRENELFPGIGGPSRCSVRILNPIATEEPELRLSLCPGLLRAVLANLSVGERSVALFTAGKVFWMGERPAEGRRLAAVLAGPLPRLGLGQRQRPEVDFLDVKGILEGVLEKLGLLDRVRWQRPRGERAAAFHPGKSALAVANGQAIGIVGALHPSIEAEIGMGQGCWLFELDLEQALDYGRNRPIFEDLPRFPVVVRDVAVLADDEFPSDRVVRFVREWNAGLIDRVALFDRYVGSPVPEGKKSLAYSIAYRALDRTLTDDEVNRLHEQLLADMSAQLPIELRR